MPDREIYHVISNTHWDREWYQSHEKFLVRLVELFDRLTDILERKPDYRFVTDGQYALVDDYITARPEMRERIGKLVSRGQLLVGPWYTQPLENITGGEALVRNLQYGTYRSEELGGAMRFSYEIDEFGHASQMPQILAGFGINGAMAWRGVPKNSKSVIRWEAPDGTAAYMFCSRAGYGFATTLPENEDDFDETIDGVVFHRRGIKNRVKALREYSAVNSESNNMCWLNGIDHSWAQEDVLEVIEKINRLFPDIEVRQSTPNEYADAVLADYKSAGKTPVTTKGELLYTCEDILESTNALHPRQKIRHYTAEKHLTQRFEPLASFAWLLGAKYPQWAADRAWKYVLENHAHDSLGCCSVDEVFEQVMSRYGASISLCEQEEDNALRYIMSCSSDEPSVFVFNMSSYKASGVKRITLDIPAGMCKEGLFSLFTPDGRRIPVEILEKSLVGDVRYNPRRGHPTWGRRYHVEAVADLPEVEPMGWIKLNFVSEKDESRIDNRRYYSLERHPLYMENEFLTVGINSDGTFDVTDKRNGRTYPGQLLFEDTGECADVYVHTEPSDDRRRIYPASADSIACLYDTPLGTAYEICTHIEVPDGLTPDRKHRSDVCRPLKIRTEISLMKGDGKIGIKIHAENSSRFHRLRVLFPSFLENAVMSAGGQPFDTAKRPIHTDFDPELPREQDYPTKPFIDYCFVSEDGAGLGVGAKGIYEYECTDDNAHALALTLMRCVEDIDTKTFAETPEYKCTEAQNLTSIDYELALIPFGGDVSQLLKAAAPFVAPLITVFNRTPEDSVMPGYVRPAQTVGSEGSFIRVDGEGVEITGVMRAMSRDSLIVRLLNTTDCEVDASVSLTAPCVDVTAVYETDLEENRLGVFNGSKRLAPHRLMTVEFLFGSGKQK